MRAPSYGSISTAPSSGEVSDEENVLQSTTTEQDVPNVIAKKASMSAQIANMTNSIIGGGVLSLPGGIALYASRSVPVDATVAGLWTLALGAVFAYFCWLIGRVCVQTKTTSYRDAWIRTVGERGSTWIALANTLDPLLGLFANASIVAQSLQLLLQGIVNFHWTETQCLLVATIVAILPLCLVKNLKALAPFSAVGMVAVIGALVAMTARYVDGSYRPNGTYFLDLPPSRRHRLDYANDETSMSEGLSTGISVLPFVCMVFTSFDMHYNSPRFYAELKDATVSRYGATVSWSFGLTSLLYMAVAVVGFLTFGQACDSFVLNNYSPRDPLATLSRVAMSLSSLLTYPLNFIGVRDNVLDMIWMKQYVNATSVRRNTFTIALLGVISLISCYVTDLGVISAVGGGTTVTLVCFVFPACMFVSNAIQNNGSLNEDNPKCWQNRPSMEGLLVLTLMLASVVVGLIGTWCTVSF